MTELFRSLGFRSHPFSKYSAEEELEYLGDIFVQPRYFNSLLSDLESGASRFILGERGSGKSALIFELNKTLNDKQVLSVIVDNYDSIPLTDNDRHLLYLIIKSILKSYVAALFKNPQLLENLNKTDKEKLALIIRDFFTSIGRREFSDAYNKVTKYKTKNWFRNIWNKIFNKPINWALSATIELGSDFVAKSFGLTKLPTGNFYKNYLPEIELEKLPEKQKMTALLSNYALLKEILIELIDIVKKSGFETTVVFLDKIDEYKLLDGKIKKIVDFTEQILKDTSLLYLNNLSIVFSIWTEVKIELNSKGVRFDKFKPIDVTWTNEDIAAILQKRLNHFSTTREYDVNKIVSNQVTLNKLIELSYKSPRDMIRLFSTIFDEQAIRSSMVTAVENESIDSARINFCKSYDYYSIFPSQRGTKEDIISIVNRILRVGKVKFKSNDLVAEFKHSQQSAINYIKIYKDYGLIKDDGNVAGRVPKEFEVIDPKLIYLIQAGLKSMS